MRPVTSSRRFGETAPFDVFYRDEFLRAARLAHLLTGSNDAAEDIAQEAFVRLRTKLGEIENPGAYLHRSIVNLSRSWHRSHTRRIGREERWQRSITPMDANDDPHGELLGLIDELPFRQRAALVARYWLDLPEAEIANLIGCRPGTVKSLTSRALNTIRKELS